ncbi:hypothetical protein P3S68_017338 [Capsicum galapagoense]
MPMNNPNAVFGDLVLKCLLGKPFDELRSIMKKENIDGFFKKSSFAYFLELSGPRPLRFPMIMVYGLLKRRIMYAGKDGGPKKGRNKIDEVWINYCGMSICFGLKEFAIVMGLRCDRPEELAIKKTPHKGDVKKVIERDLLALADDFGIFNDYPWGYDNYYLIVKYLLKEIKPKTTTLYGFSWAFMAWVVHPWIVPTIDELGMTSFLTLGFVDTKEDPTVELKKELDGATSIRRAVRQGQSNVEALHDLTQAATDPGASSGGVAGGVVCDRGSHPVSASAANRDYENVGAQ